MALLVLELHKPNRFEKGSNKYFWPLMLRWTAIWRTLFIPAVSKGDCYSVNGFSSIHGE